MASDSDRIAQVWPGWRTEGLIGRGGFGSVYRVSRTVANYTSTAAVKIIDVPSDTSDIKELRSMGMDDASIHDYFGQAARSLMNEIAAMDSLKGSANIVQIEDYQLREQKDGPGWTVFIRMELLESLEAYQERVGLPDQWEAARIGSQICNALVRCHAIGIIHRDVKPANIFRNKFGDYKLGDFGIAKNLDNATHSTMSFAGTRPFMAPEVESGHYDGSVDTYSLGIMLYRWLNGGRPPFVGPDEVPTQAVLARAQARRFAGQRPPLPAGPGVDSELASLVAKACEPEPASRWASAEEFGRALQSWLGTHPVPADTATASPTISAAAFSSIDDRTIGAEANSPSTSALNDQHQDSNTSTIDFKAWLGSEWGKPKAEPVPKPAPKPEPAPKPKPVSKPAQQKRPAAQPNNPPKTSGKAENSASAPKKTVSGASSGSEPAKASAVKPAPTADDNAKKRADDRGFVFSIVMGLLSAVYVIYYNFAEYQQNDSMLMLPFMGLFVGIFVFIGFGWAFHTLESADSMWQRVLIIIAAGCLTLYFGRGDLQAAIDGTRNNWSMYNYAAAFIPFTIIVAGPIGSVVNFVAKKLRKK